MLGSAAGAAVVVTGDLVHIGMLGDDGKVMCRHDCRTVDCSLMILVLCRCDKNFFGTSSERYASDV